MCLITVFTRTYVYQQYNAIQLIIQLIYSVAYVECNFYAIECNNDLGMAFGHLGAIHRRSLTTPQFSQTSTTEKPSSETVCSRSLYRTKCIIFFKKTTWVLSLTHLLHLNYLISCLAINKPSAGSWCTPCHFVTTARSPRPQSYQMQQMSLVRSGLCYRLSDSAI